MLDKNGNGRRVGFVLSQQTPQNTMRYACFTCVVAWRHFYVVRLLHPLPNPTLTPPHKLPLNAIIPFHNHGELVSLLSKLAAPFENVNATPSNICEHKYKYYECRDRIIIYEAICSKLVGRY